jgi:predicted RNA-binding protein with PUA-like domain
MRYWLLKTEPESFSIQDLAAAPQRTTCWDGVRNYQARNFIRDDMRPGDRVLFYHSSADPPAIVGTAIVVRPAYADHTAWDPRDHHYDPKASPENPIWQMVDIQLDEVFARPLSLPELRGEKALAGMELLRRGSRLSVQPVKPAEFAAVMRMAKGTGSAGQSTDRKTIATKGKVAVGKSRRKVKPKDVT